MLKHTFDTSKRNRFPSKAARNSSVIVQVGQGAALSICSMRNVFTYREALVMFMDCQLVFTLINV